MPDILDSMLILSRKISGKVAVLGLFMLLLSLWQGLEGTGDYLFGSSPNETEVRFEIIKVEESVQVTFKRSLPAIKASFSMEREDPVRYCCLIQVCLPKIYRCFDSQSNRDPPLPV